MSSLHARVASADAYQLGEGPVWDGDRSRILWVDILEGKVIEGILDGDEVVVTATHNLGGMVSAAVPTDSGAILLARQEELVVLEPGGELRRGARIVSAGSGDRCNDGAVDPAGRFLVGTLALRKTDTAQRLLRVEQDGRVTTVDDDLTLSNGLAWSPDGTLLYSVDTLSRRIRVRDYDSATGEMGERREHLFFDDGYPDGICVDADGCLWVAVWGAGEVRRFSHDGAQLESVKVPAPHVSSVALVSADLDLLLITTAREGLTPDELAANPLSGHLFSVRVGAVGLAPPPAVL